MTPGLALESGEFVPAAELNAEALRLAAWHEHQAKTSNAGDRALHLASAAEFRRLAAQQPVAAVDLAALNHDLVAECERAMQQRDVFLKTGVSTAGHGGSHDTCFPAVLRKHGLYAATTLTPGAAIAAGAETLGVYCGIASDDVTDPTHPRYVAGFKVGHARGRKRASQGQAPAAPPECKTEAERTAFAFGWFKALEQQRGQATPSPQAAQQAPTSESGEKS